MYLLQRELGVACAIPIGVAICTYELHSPICQYLTSSIVSFLGSLGATSLVMQRQALWLEAIERRIAATSAMLESMKGVKMCGLTDVLRDDLQRLRVDELDISKKFRRLMIWTMMICQYAYVNCVFAVLIDYSLHLADNIPYSCVCGVLDTCSE
jgi:ATP-binding cassette subfamily C (CFTR/MRP) protein 1